MNFIEIDRTILKTLGFKTPVTEQKDKDGNIVVDETGNPKLKYRRHDFTHAVRFFVPTKILLKVHVSKMKMFIL